MYSIDINFLKDREPSEVAGSSQPTEIADSQFIVYGGIAAGVAVLLAGGYYFFVSSQIPPLQATVNAKTAEKEKITGRANETAKIQEEITKIQAQTNGLTGLFVQQVPAYALLSDLQRRTKDTVQLNNFAQTDKALIVDGTAKDYDSLNNYLLLLKSSPLLDPAATQLVSARLGAGEEPVVSFSIRTAVTPKRADEIQKVLEEAGAEGLLIRLRDLQKAGVIGGAPQQ